MIISFLYALNSVVLSVSSNFYSNFKMNFRNICYSIISALFVVGFSAHAEKGNYKNDTFFLAIRNESDTLPNINLDSIDRANNEMIKIANCDVTKAEISKSDSSIEFYLNKYRDHRIFGYERPDINSKRLICVSIFTSDVKENPFKCPLGAYYDNPDSLEIKFISREKNFIKAKAIKKGEPEIILYFEKKWIKFQK